MKVVQSFGIEPQVGSLYERADIAQANWFIAATGPYQYPQPENDYLKASFNLDHYCKRCGMAKVQNAPYRLKTAPMQHNNQFWGLLTGWKYEF